MQQGNIRLYGCGGFGINIMSHFDSAAGNAEVGHSIPHPVYIDTSRSNLKSSLNDEHISILEGVDGSGKVRRENHEEIAKNIRAMLQKHQPMDFNIVAFSASGGSGSVFGPLLMAELLTRGLPVVAVVVGSDESNITAQNTLNTLKSLEAIATKADLPAVVFYEHNEPTIKRSEIDSACRHTIAALSILCSKHNAELDSKDIQNWVQFNRSTSVRARLALLEVYRSNEEAEQAQEPIAIASLYDSTDATPVAAVPEYSCVGYPSQAIPKMTVIHYVINVAGVPIISKKCQQRINDLDQARKSRVDHATIVSDADEVTRDGLVL